jgi:oxalate decarboxylase
MQTNDLNGDRASRLAPEPVDGERGASILGPRNAPLEAENPSLLASPATDAGTIPNLKFSFAAARNRLLSGGWAREVTTRELPVAKTLAGVNMRLKPGGIRELHWHKEAEWAYMLAGTARITAVDQEGRNFIDDVGAGDVWNFPAGIPHSIQGLEDGCEFLLVFDDGNFSENETFLVTDWFAHTPREVLGKNFGVPESAFANIPIDVDRERYIFDGAVPPALGADEVPSAAGTVPNSFSHRLSEQEPIKVAGGQVRIVDSRNFPAAGTIAAALVEVEPGAIRELHWHPNADEWQYYISGKGRMSVFASAGKSRTFDYQAGDVGYIPFAMGHYIENTGDEPLRFLEMFRSDHFADVSLSQWMALTPAELVQAHLNLDARTMTAIARATDKPVIAQSASASRSFDVLPEWPTSTIGMLSTVDEAPYEIPVTAPLRVGNRRIMFTLKHSRASLDRLRERPQAALLILGDGDLAFTARGRTRIAEERMATFPEYAAVVLDVEDIDDHRQTAFAVDSGVRVQWTDEDAQRALHERIAALRKLARTVAG